MRVLFVSAEVYPLAKAGGLADVSAALPVALRAIGIDVRVLVPGYRQARSCVGAHDHDVRGLAAQAVMKVTL